jgi:hypothetical protein
VLDLALQFFKQAAFHLSNLTATQTCDVNVIARTVTFVVVLVAANMEQVQLVNQAELLQHIQSAIDRDAVDAGINFLGALEDGPGVQVLLGIVHYFQQNAALACDADSAFGKGGLKTAGPGMGVQSFAAGYTMSVRERHLRLQLRAVNPLRVLEEAQNVIVHDDGEDDQDEDKSDLKEAFLRFQAQIMAQGAFDGEHHDVAAI